MAISSENIWKIWKKYLNIFTLSLTLATSIASGISSGVKKIKLPMMIVILCCSVFSFFFLLVEYILIIKKERKRGALCIGYYMRRLNGKSICYPAKLSALIVSLITIISAIGDVLKAIEKKEKKPNITVATIVGSALTLLFTVISVMLKKQGKISSNKQMKLQVENLWENTVQQTIHLQNAENASTNLQIVVEQLRTLDLPESQRELLDAAERTAEYTAVLIQSNEKLRKIIQDIVEQNNICRLERKYEGDKC